MGIFISKKERERLQSVNHDSFQWKCYDAIRERVCKNTKENTLVQPGDTQEWYHLCWERISDASFIYHMEEDAALGRWLHDRVLEIVRKSADEWLGPWYRNRSEDADEQEGYPETSHITLAVCEALDNCDLLFTEEELAECREAIRVKGMLPCMRYCNGTVARANHINNWFMVLLNGFGAAAVLLGDSEAVRLAVEYSHVAASLYNEDSYGESLQYSNYATLHLSHLFEVLIRSGQADRKELNLQCYTNLMTWYAASFLCRKELKKEETVYPRFVNFGDSAAIFRPSGDVLVQVASRMKECDKRAAGLASWMFMTLYADPYAGPDELASFSLYSHFQYHSVLMLPDCIESMDPAQAGLSQEILFSGGHVIVRDAWENAGAVVALQAGYQPYNVTSHRHRDQNSFQLTIGKERMLVDPGHCCYRLKAQKEAVSEFSHNTFSIRRSGQFLEQREVDGNIYQRKAPGNQLLVNDCWKNIRIIASDMAALYEVSVEKAIRVWIMNLPHQMMTVDIIKTKDNTSLYTHFCVNNRDNQLREHIYSQHRLVFRRNGEALKLFEVYSETDGKACTAKFSFDWTAMHDYYHPLANQEGQGKEGSVNRYWWEDNPGRNHLRMHTYVMDTSEEIVHWHVYLLEDGYVRMENPTRDAWIDVAARMDQITIRNEKNEENYYNL